MCGAGGRSLVCEAHQQRESTAVHQTLHYQHSVEQTEQLHAALKLERIQGKNCNRKGFKQKSVSGLLLCCL